MLGLVEQVKAYERLTVAAAISGDRARRCGRSSPTRWWAATRRRPMLDALLEAHSQHLPRFHA